MKLHPQPHPRRAKHLPVVWQDCAWFPPVLAGKRSGSARHRRPVYWPVQIITDPNVCIGRALSIHQL
jgi:hypothetical protein